MTAVVPPRITVMVAAHNEERDVEATLRSALDQTTRPDRVLVAADNCTDSTVAVARSIPGVDVFETVANRHRKAGALNQAWEIARSSTGRLGAGLPRQPGHGRCFGQVHDAAP
jgi:glycosyltransferase involved in cell wall biosynthesis